ncbi:hypothetical protein MMC17_008952 [Xylographa soralifera]|nr:hypothetical protein [Xylographa soralifera]
MNESSAASISTLTFISRLKQQFQDLLNDHSNVLKKNLDSLTLNQKALTDTQEKYTKLKAIFNEALINLRSVGSELDKCQKLNEKYSAKIRTLTQTIEENDGNIAEVNTQLKTCKQRMARDTQSLRELNESNEEFMKEVKVKQKDWELKQKSWEGLESTLKIECESLKAKVEERDARILQVIQEKLNVETESALAIKALKDRHGSVETNSKNRITQKTKSFEDIIQKLKTEKSSLVKETGKEKAELESKFRGLETSRLNNGRQYLIALSQNTFPEATLTRDVLIEFDKINSIEVVIKEVPDDTQIQVNYWFGINVGNVITFWLAC